MSPFESWLLLRSLRTLKIHMFQHQENALRIAHFLEQHPKIKKVSYPGLESFDQYHLVLKQMSSFSGLMSFTVNSGSLEEITNSLIHFLISR